MSIAKVGQSRPAPAASAGAPARIRNRWAEFLISSDPGLKRLRGAAQSVLTIAVVLGAEWTFVHLTGALQIESGATHTRLLQWDRHTDRCAERLQS